MKSEKKRKNESEVFQVRTKDFQRNIEDIIIIIMQTAE